MKFALKKPGAFHHAQFMGKSIYLFKIYICSLLFVRLTNRETKSHDRTVLFILSLYSVYFLKSSITVIAPRVDLQFLNQLTMYEAIDSEISKIAVKAFKRHQWYRTPELVTLSLFDEETSYDEKNAIANRILK